MCPLCPVLCHLHQVMLWNAQSAGLCFFNSSFALYCISVPGPAMTLSIFKKYFEVERSHVAWKGSLSGQRCLQILGGVQVHKGSTWRSNKRLQESTAGYQNACRARYYCWGCKCWKTKRRTLTAAYLVLDKLVELKKKSTWALSSCPIISEDFQRWQYWPRNQQLPSWMLLCQTSVLWHHCRTQLFRIRNLFLDHFELRFRLLILNQTH